MELEALGAEVLYVAADVARPEEMRAAVRAARERFGPIQRRRPRGRRGRGRA